MCSGFLSPLGSSSGPGLGYRSPFQQFRTRKAHYSVEIGKRDRLNRRAVDGLLDLVPKVLLATAKQQSGFLDRDKLLRFDSLNRAPRLFCFLISGRCLLRGARRDHRGEQSFPELVADPRQLDPNLVGVMVPTSTSWCPLNHGQKI